MSGFSASEAALEGFRITRENPRAFGAWVGVSFAISVLGAVVTVMMPPEVRHGLETLRGDETPSIAQLMDALIAVAPILILGLAIQCIMAAAVYRLILRHDDTRFGYLRLGADELRLMGLTLIYIALFMALLVAVTLGAAVIAAWRPSPARARRCSWRGGGAVLPGACGLRAGAPVARAGGELRRAPAGAFRVLAADARAFLAVVRRLRPGARLHRRRGLPALVVFTGVAGVVVLLTGGQLADLSGIFKPDETSIRTYFNPGLIAYMVIGSVFSALYYAVIARAGRGGLSPPA